MQSCCATLSVNDDITGGMALLEEAIQHDRQYDFLGDTPCIGGDKSNFAIHELS